MDDIQLLATIIQGEAAVLGPAGMTAVAAVFIARLLSPSFPSTVQHVAPPFYGRALPGPTAHAIATHALADPAPFLQNFTTHSGGPYLHLLSAQDRHRLNARIGDFQLIRSRMWQLHFYQEAPLVIDHPLPPAHLTRSIHGRPHPPHQDLRLR